MKRSIKILQKYPSLILRRYLWIHHGTLPKDMELPQLFHLTSYEQTQVVLNHFLNWQLDVPQALHKIIQMTSTCDCADYTEPTTPSSPLSTSDSCNVPVRKKKIKRNKSETKKSCSNHDISECSTTTDVSLR
jgi:hypothetical protein